MAAKTSKRFNLFAGVIVVALLVLAGVALYARLASSGANDAEHKAPSFQESLTQAQEAIEQGTTVSYGDYTSELTLGGTVFESEVYHFSANTIQIGMYPYTTGGEGVSNYFTIELHRIEAGVVDVLVGSQSVSRKGFVIAQWDDTPEGDYYFVFRKDADNQVIHADRVTMTGFWIEHTNE